MTELSLNSVRLVKHGKLTSSVNRVLEASMLSEHGNSHTDSLLNQQEFLSMDKGLSKRGNLYEYYKSRKFIYYYTVNITEYS